MDLVPHDLLKIRGSDDLVCFTSQPDWVKTSIGLAPYVVVRRVKSIDQMVPVGVRGEGRSQRFGAFLPLNKIIERISPEDLVERKSWEYKERAKQVKAIQVLPIISQIFGRHCLKWGPTGSVGFELASGIPTATLTSDLDVIVRTPEPISMSKTGQLVKDLSKLSVKIDVQLESPQGGISLSEFAKAETSTILLKNEVGPRLIDRDEIWEET